MVASMVPITTLCQFNTGGTELVLQRHDRSNFPSTVTFGIHFRYLLVDPEKDQYKCIVAWNHCFRTCHERNWNSIIDKRNI